MTVTETLCLSQYFNFSFSPQILNLSNKNEFLTRPTIILITPLNRQSPCAIHDTNLPQYHLHKRNEKRKKEAQPFAE